MSKEIGIFFPDIMGMAMKMYIWFYLHLNVGSRNGEELGPNTGGRQAGEKLLTI